MISKKGKGSILINIIYSMIWIIPFLIFFRDFMEISSLKEIFETKTLRILKNTMIQSFLSTLFAFLISLIPAYYVSKHKNFISRWIESSVFIPFFFPPISAIVAFSIIYSIPVIKKLEINYSLTAIIIAHVFYNSPIFVKYIGEALRKVPKTLIEQSKIDGLSKFKLFFKIELPIILPSVFRGFFLVFTYCFTSFAIVLSLGNIKYSTFEVSIVQNLVTSLNFSKALGYAVIQFSLLAVVNLIISNLEEYKLEENFIKEKKRHLFISSFSVFYLVFEFLILGIGLIFSVYNFYLGKFNFKGITKIFSKEFNKSFPVIESIFNSIFISGIVSLLSVIFVYLLLKYKTKFSNFIILSTIGISSAFLGMVLLYLNIMYYIPYPVLIGLGYLLITIPIGYSFMYQHIRGFDYFLIEAGKIDGARNFQIFRFIEFPILKPIFISTFLQIFAIVYGEFTIAYTMQMQEYFPIASVVNYSMASRRLLQESSTFSAINILIIFSLFLFSKKIRHNNKKNKKGEII
ncbi:MAG: ABC transporter permease [Fusobacteriota bacterium]